MQFGADASGSVESDRKPGSQKEEREKVSGRRVLMPKGSVEGVKEMKNASGETHRA